MRKPPLIATRLFEQFGPNDEALFGDLVEEHGSGRSLTWYWSQVVASVALHTSRRATAEPLRALAAFATGWLVALALFFGLGNYTTLAILRGLGWRPFDANGLEAWWPLYAAMAAAAVSCLVFSIATLAVVRLNGGRWAFMLGPFVLSVALAQVGISLARSFMVPWRSDTLFYLAPIGFRFQFYWGSLLILFVMLAVGVIAAPQRDAALRSTQL